MSDLIGLLLGVCVVAPVLAFALVRLVFAFRAAEQRHWLATQRAPIPPVAAGGRAPRGDRVPRPVVSPAAGGRSAAEVTSPGVHTSAADVETQR